MLSVSLDTSKLFARLDRAVKVITQGARPAAQAGAQVFYDELRTRVSTIGNPGQFSTPGSAPLKKTGGLEKSIYQYFEKDESTYTSATYKITWRKKDAFYGRMLENGTSKMAARPHLRPTYDTKRTEAIAAVNERLGTLAKAALK